MHRLVVVLVVVASVRPAFAADAGVTQQDVVQQLKATSAQINDLDRQMASLDQSTADTQLRVEQERAQVRMLARVLYAQPDSLAATVIESSSLAEAVTRIADLTSAGDRAAATRRALDQDLARLSRDRARLQSDRDHEVALQKQLETQFAMLVAQGAAAARAPSPVPAAGLDPGSVAAIKQIILNAFAPLGPAGQQWALRVAMCESSYNPYAVNWSSGASGLFQFLPSTWAGSPYHNQSVFDPVANAQAAAWLYQRSGPGQWQCK